MLITHVCKLLAIGGAEYTAKGPPDYSRYSASDIIGMIAVLSGIIFFLLYLLSHTGRPPRNR
jgi:hypothetical protein